MEWALIGLCAVLAAGCVGLTVHFLDVLTEERKAFVEERKAHREEVRALLARAGAPVLSLQDVLQAQPHPLDPNKFAWDPSGLEAPIRIEDE